MKNIFGGGDGHGGGGEKKNGCRSDRKNRTTKTKMGGKVQARGRTFPTGSKECTTGFKGTERDRKKALRIFTGLGEDGGDGQKKENQ